MKKNILIVFIMLFSLSGITQGKYAGSMKKLIGQKIADEKHIPGLSGWKFMEGSLITKPNDGDVMTADVFKKGTTWLVVFGETEEYAVQEKKYVIVDLLEVKSVPSTLHIRTGLCQEGESENGIDIVALIKKENTESSKAIKAWRLNRDKRRIELMSAKLVKCMNEVD